MAARSDRLRDGLLFVLVALLPTAAAALLGLRAIQNEEAAVRRELELGLAQTVADVRAKWERGLAAIERSDPPPSSAPAQRASVAPAGSTRREEPARALPVPPPAAPFAEGAVVDARGALLAPATAELGLVRAEPLPDCGSLADRIARSPNHDERARAMGRFLEGCELAQSATGRWLWPVIALSPAAEGLCAAARTEAWLVDGAGLLSPAERSETLADVRRSAALDAAARSRILAALVRAPAAAPELRALVQMRRRAFLTAGPGETTVRWDDPHSVGRFRAEPDGSFTGYVVHAGSIARALAAGWPARPAEVQATLVAVPGLGRASVIELLPGGLGLELAPASGAAVEARTRRARLLLWGLLGMAVMLSVGTTGVLYARMRAERRLGALRTDFVAAVSHELRTPIASVRMLSELLAQGAVEPDEQQEVLDALAAEACRLGHTVDRLLTFSRMNAGRATATLARVAVGDLLNRTADTFRCRYPESDLVVAVEPPTLVTALDAAQIEMALDNLLGNARKYAPEGAPYELRAEQRGSELWLSLRDHGPGVAPGVERQIFEPFERADDRLSRATEGSGIGLSLVRHVARAHGGRAWVESKLGGGATFIIAIPLRDTSTGPDTANGAETPKGEP